MKPFLLALLLTVSSSYALSAPSVEIVWEPVTSYEDGAPVEEGQVVKYEVWRSQNSSLTAPIRVASDLTSVRYVDSTVTPKNTFYYWVRAYLIDGLFGADSDAASARIWPPFKTKISAIAVIK